MKYPVAGKITELFDAPRPFYLQEKIKDGTITESEKKKLHVHGAIDIGNKIGTPIYAPETGYAFIYNAIRPTKHESWAKEDVIIDGQDFPFKNYFSDVYGTIIILQVPYKNNVNKIMHTHLFAHMYANQGFNKIYTGCKKIRKEEKKDCRFPVHCWYTEKMVVKKGELIGMIGNSGYSTGPHTHWEIHHGYQLEDYKDRIDPVKFMEDME